MSRRLIRHCIAPAIFTVAFLPQPGRAGGGSCQTGAGLFDYGPHRADQEAEQLAMILSGELRAPDAVYDRILRDLALIRSAFPILGPATASLEFIPNELNVELDPAQPTTGYDALNAFYQVVTDEVTSGTTHRLTFCDNINAPVLAAEYETLPEVINAFRSLANVIGGSNDYAVSVDGDTYHYNIGIGFGDCLSGCLCTELWWIDVALDGTVSLAGYLVVGGGDCTRNVACCSETQTCAVTRVEPCITGGGTPLAVGQTCSACGLPVPTVSEWGIVILALILFVTGSVIHTRSAAA